MRERPQKVGGPKFVSDSRAIVFEGRIKPKDEWKITSNYCKFVKLPITKRAHTVEELFMQEFIVNNEDLKRKDALFVSELPLRFAAYIVDGTQLFFVSDEFLKVFGMMEQKPEFDKKNPDIRSILIDAIRNNITVSDEQIKQALKDDLFSISIEIAARKRYLTGKYQELTPYTIGQTIALEKQDIVGYLANPLTWANEYVERFKEKDYINNIKRALITDIATEQVYNALVAKPSDESRALRSLMDAASNLKTIQLTVKVNGNKTETSYSVMDLIRCAGLFHDNGISVQGISPIKERIRICDFVGVDDFEKGFVPIKYIKSAQSRKKTIWENPMDKSSD